MLKKVTEVFARLAYRVAFGHWLGNPVPVEDTGKGYFVVVQKYNGTSDDRIFSVRTDLKKAQEDKLVADADKDPFQREVVVVHVT